MKAPQKQKRFSFGEKKELPTSQADSPFAEGGVADLNDLVAQRRHAGGLTLAVRNRVRTTTAGIARSAFRGRGMVLEEGRAYQPGDDVRLIDWRVTARTGRVHTKLYQEERERPVYLLVDSRPPMRFGTRVAFKSVAAARGATALSWAALGGGDRVGGMLLSSSGGMEMAPQRNRRRVMRFLQGISSATAEESQDSGPPLSETLARLRRVMRMGGLVFVLSDFSDFDEEARRHLTRVAMHCDLVCIQVADPLELAPPPPAMYRVTDGEEVMMVDATDSRWRNAYAGMFHPRRAAVDDFCREKRATSFLLRTDEDTGEALRNGLFAVTRVHAAARRAST